MIFMKIIIYNSKTQIYDISPLSIIGLFHQLTTLHLNLG